MPTLKILQFERKMSTEISEITFSAHKVANYLDLTLRQGFFHVLGSVMHSKQCSERQTLHSPLFSMVLWKTVLTEIGRFSFSYRN